MPRRRQRTGTKPLEWIGVDVSKAAGGATTLEAVNFNLDDDEVAEIWLIDSEIIPDVPATLVSDAVAVSSALVLDPSYPTGNAPVSEAVYEDLETLFTHVCDYVIDAHDTAASVDMLFLNRWNKQLNLMGGVPILSATNLGYLTTADAGIAIDFDIRVYFTRKKATDIELARTLLKRR